MPNIVIREIDETTPGVNSESFEVAYIPGCVDISQESLYRKSTTEDGVEISTYVGLEINKPTLFTSVSQFESLCGTKGLTFTEDKDYRTLITEDCTGFSSAAVPFDKIMFKKGDIDPAYVMAKELLAAGLNVLYERINPDQNLVEVVPEFGTETDANKVKTPEDWSTKYTDYITEFDRIQKISDSTPPNIGYEYDAESPLILPMYEFIQASETTRLKDENDVLLEYYEKVIEGETQNNGDGTTTELKVFRGKYTNAEYDEKGEFIKDHIYFRKGRTFYKAHEEDGNQRVFTWALVDVIDNETKKEKVELQDSVVFDLIEEIPEDWAKTYWKDYFEVVEVKTNIPELTTAPDKAFFLDLEAKNRKLFRDENGISLTGVYNALSNVYEKGSADGLVDKGNFSIKYLTSGGYPVYEYNNNSIVTKMMELAQERGDCVAIIDHTDNLYRESNIALVGSLYKTVCDDLTFQEGGEYATMFTPWATYNRTTVDKDGNKALTSKSFRMPASYAYLIALADSIKTNASWLAIAGATRGIVGNLASGGMTTDIPNGAADSMQPRQGISVNAITNIKPYGYTIWGNRTLKKNPENLIATSFLNIRNLVSDVKKTCYRAARGLTFEQNTDVLWVNFKSKIAPTLDRMLSGYGISGYKIVRDTQHEKAAEKATICAKVILYPVYAVEDFYITIVLKDDEITVESAE